MDAESRSAVGRWVAKSHEDMEAVALMLQRGHERAAVSIAYFAAFHIAAAALLAQAVRRSRRSRIRAAFDKYLVKPGLIEPEYAHVLARLETAREKADYRPELHDVSGEIAKPFVADAETFVTRMELYLKDVGAIE